MVEKLAQGQVQTSIVNLLNCFKWSIPIMTMNSRLLAFDDIDNFSYAKSINATDITTEHLTTIRGLDERTELEPSIRKILGDVNETPHGPVEIVDILTHHIVVSGKPVY